MKGKIVAMTFKLDEGLKEELEKYSKMTRQTMSRLVREAIIREMTRIQSVNNKVSD